MGFQNGSIRVYLLVEKNDFAQLGPYWTRWCHDHDYGDVSSIAHSYDDRYVFSTGLDGNVFVYMTADSARFEFGSKPSDPQPIPSASVFRFTVIDTCQLQ